MGKRQEAKAATRGKVLEAARVCFYAHGYEGTTVRMVAEHAGMSVGAIFASFSSKADLYRGVFGHEPITPEAGRQLLEALRDLEPFLDAIVCYASTVDEHEPNRLARNAHAIIARVGAV